MNVPRSTFYKGNGSKTGRMREEARTRLRSEIEEVVADWPAYGYRRVTHELKRRGVVANHKRVSRIMREEALTPRRVKRFIATTDSNHSLPVFPNQPSLLIANVRPGFRSYGRQAIREGCPP